LILIKGVLVIAQVLGNRRQLQQALMTAVAWQFAKGIAAAS
jgi:hypothetical protein